MAFTLTIGGTDFSGYVAADGYDWERNDIDAPNSGRDMNGTMRRRVVARKDKLQVTCRPLTQNQLSTLWGKLTSTSVSVTYSVPGQSNRTATFYNSKKSAGIQMDLGSAILYKGASFDLIEV